MFEVDKWESIQFETAFEVSINKDLKKHYPILKIQNPFLKRMNEGF